MSNRVANAVFACCCLAVAGAAAVRPRPAVHEPVAREHVVAAGTPDPFPVPASAAVQSLCVVISTECRACTESLPFYRRLARAATADTELLFVGVEPEADLQAYLRRGGVGGRVVSTARPLPLPGTPSIVLLDAARRVERSWAGRLSPDQERELIALVSASPRRSSGSPEDASRLLARARARLSVTRDVATVASLAVTGTETLLRDTGARAGPYAFKLLLPDHLQLRAGPVLHTLAGAAYGRRLVDTTRYGGPLLDRMLADPESRRTAARGMHSHLLRLSLLYLARAPAVATAPEDEGLRDFGVVKGRTLLFRDPVEELRAEVVLDPSTAALLAVVTPVRTVGGAKAGTESNWISMPADYREVGGVRIPHRLDDWNGGARSRVELSAVRVGGLGRGEFTMERR